MRWNSIIFRTVTVPSTRPGFGPPRPTISSHKRLHSLCVSVTAPVLSASEGSLTSTVLTLSLWTQPAWKAHLALQLEISGPSQDASQHILFPEISHAMTSRWWDLCRLHRELMVAHTPGTGPQDVLWSPAHTWVLPRQAASRAPAPGLLAKGGKEFVFKPHLRVLPM